MPEFQDTYGWILFLRGDAAEAREHLATAGAALPGNAQVQFHLGEAERALGNRDAAAAAYAAALAAAEAGSPRPRPGPPAPERPSSRPLPGHPALRRLSPVAPSVAPLDGRPSFFCNGKGRVGRPTRPWKKLHRPAGGPARYMREATHHLGCAAGRVVSEDEVARDEPVVVGDLDVEVRRLVAVDVTGDDTFLYCSSPAFPEKAFELMNEKD